MYNESMRKDRRTEVVYDAFVDGLVQQNVLFTLLIPFVRGEGLSEEWYRANRESTVQC